MKILFTISYFLPYISGLTIHVARIAEALSKKGWDVWILTSQHKKNLSISENIKGSEIVRVPFLFKISKGTFMPLYFWQAIKLVRQSDVVVVNLPQFEGFIPALCAKIFKKKLFCIYHCEVTLPRGFINYFIEKILELANLIPLKVGDKIITYTKDYANHSRILPRFKDKLFYNFPPIPKPSIDGEYRKKLQRLLPKKKYIIGVAARVAAEKGIEYLLAAIPDLREKLDDSFTIVFAGAKNPVGEERYWKQITPLIRKYKNHIEFLGTISHEKMGAFYSLIDVLVLPSVNSTESFGMVQVEAMMIGVPVVASDLPGVRVPVNKTGMGELVPVKNSKKLAEAIAGVLLDRQRYLDKKNLIHQQFELEKTVKRYQELLVS